MRIKMHVPAQQDGETFFEYYGFVTIVEGNIYWYLFQNTRIEKDHICLMTSRPNDRFRDDILVGVYSTLNQGNPTIPISSAVILEKMVTDPTDEERVELMSAGLGYRDRDDPTIPDEIRKGLQVAGTIDLNKVFDVFVNRKS